MYKTLPFIDWIIFNLYAPIGSNCRWHRRQIWPNPSYTYGKIVRHGYVKNELCVWCKPAIKNSNDRTVIFDIFQKSKLVRVTLKNITVL